MLRYFKLKNLYQCLAVFAFIRNFRLNINKITPQIQFKKKEARKNSTNIHFHDRKVSIHSFYDNRSNPHFYVVFILCWKLHIRLLFLWQLMISDDQPPIAMLIPFECFDLPVCHHLRVVSDQIVMLASQSNAFFLLDHLLNMLNREGWFQFECNCPSVGNFHEIFHLIGCLGIISRCFTTKIDIIATLMDVPLFHGDFCKTWFQSELEKRIVQWQSEFSHFLASRDQIATCKNMLTNWNYLILANFITCRWNSSSNGKFNAVKRWLIIPNDSVDCSSTMSSIRLNSRFHSIGSMFAGDQFVQQQS